jgi:FkbM family methyltransferase
MLIPLQQIIEKYKLNLKGVIHVGAHFAEEHDDYLNCGISKFVYIEPCKQAYNTMVDRLFGERQYSIGGLDPYKKYLRHFDNYIKTHNIACGAEETVMDMYVSNNNQGQSNSLLKPLLHLRQHPEVVFTETESIRVIPLDELYLNKEDYNFLAMDVQGYEIEVLKGATETLKHIDCIMTEINTDETYRDCAKVWELDSFLDFYEFKRVETRMASPSVTWGDAVYLKSHLL